MVRKESPDSSSESLLELDEVTSACSTQSSFAREEEDIRLRSRKIRAALKLPPGLTKLVNEYAFDINSKNWFHIESELGEPTDGASTTITVNGRYLFVLGGWITSRAMVFDTHENQWHRLPDMLSRRFGLGAVVSRDNKYLYAVGGFGCLGEREDSISALASAEVLDLAAVKTGCERAQWKSLPPMRRPRANLGLTISSDGKIYAIGGKRPGIDVTKSCEVFDTETCNWSDLPEMNTPRGWVGVKCVPSADGKKIYAVGGIMATARAGSAAAEMLASEQYDVKTKKWTGLICTTPTGATWTCGRAGMGVALCTSGKRLFVVGGWPRAVSECYDFVTNSWTKIPCPEKTDLFRRLLPENLLPSPDGKWLYYYSNRLQAIRVAP